jgi:hypothetical protein
VLDDTAFGAATDITPKYISPNIPARKVPRSIHEGARDMARRIAKSWQGRTSRRLRKKVEMLFAPPQAHSQARSTATTGTKWCP